MGESSQIPRNSRPPMAIPTHEEAKPRLQLFPVVALLAGLVLVAAVCVLATSNQTPMAHGAVDQMLFQTQMLKGSDAEKMRASIFKELEKAMTDIRGKLTKQEADEDKVMAKNYKKNIDTEKKKIEKFFAAKK